MARDFNWPQPYFQPPGSEDCEQHAVAYMARCLGRTETIAAEVRAWHQKQGTVPWRFLNDVVHQQPVYFLGKRDQPRCPWFLGQSSDAIGWVQAQTCQRRIGLAVVHRIQRLGHAVVVLDSDDHGVLLMDPWPDKGFIREPWSWFLGPGPGRDGAHHIEGWWTCPGSSP